ncbi:MAG: glucan biosynthesis protein [Blastopirellula sp.]|nr:glucan biosynthesis protein [Blastopirellula sp.]
MNAATGHIARRHDLDSLRAVAMLLGIVLHGVLAFIPATPWAVQDARPSEGFALLMALIHGFRMPLFFLVSGFFTAMLWRKRGLQKLVTHRCMRILVPLVIGLITIVPATWVVIIGASVAGGTKRLQADGGEAGLPATIWITAAIGDVAGLESQLAAGVDVDAWDPVTGATPLAIAVWHDQQQAVEFLLEHGADVNQPCRDKSTALIAAAFFGRDEIAKTLLAHGARVDARNERGDNAAEVTYVNWSITQQIARLVHVELDQAQLAAGRLEIRSMLKQAGDTSMTEEGTRKDRTNAGAILWALILGAMMFPFFQHLWFLWFLCLLVAAFCIYALVIDSIPWKLPSWVVLSPVRYVWLIPATMLPQAAMGLLYPSFGPDTSAGLLPMPWVLAYYGIFFMFGAIYFDHPDPRGQVGRWWWLTLPVALLAVFPLGYELTMQRGLIDVEWVGTSNRRWLAVFLQATYAWFMTFGAIGMFRSLFSFESKIMRYVSDSSYWLYLVHLPLIVLVQFVICSWLLPSSLKLFLICTITIALSLLSYHFCVRYTFIGTLLNGPRRRPQVVVDAILIDEPSGEAETVSPQE